MFKLFHLGLDAMLISIVLAGIKRSTGLAPNIARIPSKNIRQFANGYLELGEWAMDLGIVVMGRSQYFTRSR